MIREFELSEINKICDNFKSASPFPHVVIENFLENIHANQLLKDFPRFDDNFAKNEFGQVGPKCAISNIKNISEEYAYFYDYINSQVFLNKISQLTGIQDLIPDPLLFGAGTHENIEGAELDPHIDFNYDNRTSNHRRLNLLIYLNKEWDVEWGGAIELHSNPFGWKDSTDVISTINCILNRCVIFETSEKSWHGFKTIRLPGDKKHLSRKLIPIYLYTKSRPANEIAPPHGTFYVPYAPNLLAITDPVLSNEVKRLLIKRDGLIKLGLETEKNLSQKYESIKKNYIIQSASIFPNVQGYYKVIHSSVKGYFHDNWVGDFFSISLNAMKGIKNIFIEGWVPHEKSIEVNLNINEILFKSEVRGKFELSFQLDIQENQILKIEIQSPITITSNTEDDRNLSFILNSIVLAH